MADNRRHTVMILSFRTDMPGQTAQTIRVYTVCHSVCIVWTHYPMAESHSSIFRVITTDYLGVQLFRKFTVPNLHVCKIWRTWTFKLGFAELQNWQIPSDLLTVKFTTIYLINLGKKVPSTAVKASWWHQVNSAECNVPYGWGKFGQSRVYVAQVFSSILF